MKKVKFTLGLMLSMLFAGASVSNAAGEYRSDRPISPDAKINVTYSVLFDSDYLAEGTKVQHGYFYYKEGSNVWDNSDPQGFYTYGDEWKYSHLFKIENGSYNYKYEDINGIETLVPIPSSSASYRGATRIYNRIRIPLAYVNGNEVKPVIKRTITLGSWGTKNHKIGDKDVPHNNIIVSDVVLTPDFLVADSATVRAKMDRGTSVAVYVYNDDVLELINKYTIYSIHYEITVRDEVASGGRDGEPQPPVYTDTKTLRGLKLNAQAGISTNPSTVGNILYVPSAKDYTFTVTSAKPITVTSNHAQYSESNNRIKVANNYDGTYSVTIRTVQANLELNIEAVGTTSEHGNGTTAVEAVADDAVWAAGGVLYVKSANAGSVAIYSLTGQLYQQGPVSGSFSATLPKGIYIVQLNGKAYKVVL